MNALIDYMAIVNSIINLGAKKLSRDTNTRSLQDEFFSGLAEHSKYVCLSAG